MFKNKSGDSLKKLALVNLFDQRCRKPAGHDTAKENHSPLDCIECCPALRMLQTFPIEANDGSSQTNEHADRLSTMQ